MHRDGLDLGDYALQATLHTKGVPGSVTITDKGNGNVPVLVAVGSPAGAFIGLSGVTTPASALQAGGAIQTPFATKTAAYSVTPYDSQIAVNTAGGAVTITLPNATTCPRRDYTIKRISATANNATVACVGGQTIDGAATYVLSAQWKFVTVCSNGTDWLIFGNN